jgi:alpha-L-rhamnosidase
MKPIVLFIFQVLFLTTICTGQQPAASSGPVLQKSMIWLSDQPEIRQEYVVFRRSFNLETIGSAAQLEIFADSRYLLWINGKYVLRGPCRFNPKRPGYDVVDVGSYLHPGRNSVVVLVHNYGGELNGHIMKHVPGFTARLSMNNREIIRTGPDWRCNGNTRYRSSPGSWNTVPDVIDARIDDAGWISPDFDDSSWPHAVSVDGALWGTLVPREIPLPMETELKDLRLLPTGQRVADALPVELTEGQEMLVDLGRMALAYTEMELDADEGSRLVMRYALRYRNGRPAEMYGDGNRYTARAGRQAFITTDQWGSHYMLVQCLTGRVKILGIKMTDRRYPFERLGKFTCSDPVLTGLWEMAVKTIEVTSDDGYGSDARERNEWIQDASKPSYFTTRMCVAGRDPEGNRVFSDPRLLKSMLRHAAEAQLPDGRLPATFPTDRGPEDCHFVIDDYSCQWFEALTNLLRCHRRQGICQGDVARSDCTGRLVPGPAHRPRPVACA